MAILNDNIFSRALGKAQDANTLYPALAISMTVVAVGSLFSYGFITSSKRTKLISDIQASDLLRDSNTPALTLGFGQIRKNTFESTAYTVALAFYARDKGIDSSLKADKALRADALKRVKELNVSDKNLLKHLSDSREVGLSINSDDLIALALETEVIPRPTIPEGYKVEFPTVYNGGFKSRYPQAYAFLYARKKGMSAEEGMSGM